MHLHDDPGRHDMSRSGIYGTTYNSPEYDRNKQPLRRVNKRIERTDELESDVQFNAAKRPKMDGQEVRCPLAYLLSLPTSSERTEYARRLQI